MTLPKALGDWDQLSCVPPSTSGNDDDSGSNRPLCVRPSRILAGEPLARASMGDRRPPTAGRARPARRVHIQNLLWLDQTRIRAGIRAELEDRDERRRCTRSVRTGRGPSQPAASG